MIIWEMETSFLRKGMGDVEVVDVSNLDTSNSGQQTTQQTTGKVEVKIVAATKQYLVSLIYQCH